MECLIIDTFSLRKEIEGKRLENMNYIPYESILQRNCANKFISNLLNKFVFRKL